MKAQILYATMTGHSRKLAEAAAAAANAPLHNLKDTPSIPPCEVLFLVSGIYGGECKPELLEYAKKLPVGQIGRIVLLTSSTRGTAQGSLRKTLENAGHTVDAEEYLCKGSFLFMTLGHPNRAELDGAAAFARRKSRG